jgi:hypothetical protein
MRKLIVPLLIFLAACTNSGTPPAPTIITVQHTDSTQAWLPGLYSCASEADIAVSVETRAADIFDPSSQLSLRLGEPDEVSSPAYEIGMEDIIIVIHPENPVRNLALADLRAMFSGKVQDWSEIGGDDIPIQLWTFSPGEDIQQVFDATIMMQQPISPRARLAVSAGSMIAGVGSNPGAIGFLPRSLAGSGIQIALIEDMPTSTSPVLVLVSPDADQTVMALVACLQSR